MITETAARARWCPLAMAKGQVQECNASGQWIDSTITGTRARYDIDATLVAAAAVNRTESGDPHPDCLCITTSCQWWRDLGQSYGTCTRFDDNMHDQSQASDDAQMLQRWCPMSRPDGTVTQGNITGTISGCSIAVVAVNRESGGQIHAGSKCIASKCMAYTDLTGRGACMAADRNMQGG